MILTPFQSSMLDIELATEGYGSTLWRAFRVPRSLERDHMERACAAVIASRPFLCLTLQGIVRSDWPVLTDLACANSLDETLDELFAKSIKLSDGALKLHWLVDGEDAIFAIGAHHAVIDFVALSDVFSVLDAALRGEKPSRLDTSASPPQSQDIRSETRRLLFWRKELANVPTTLDLGGTDPVEPADHYLLASCGSILPPCVAGRARAYGVTPFVLALTAIGAVLARRSGFNECIIGVPYHGRSGANRKRALANVITLPLRIRINSDDTFPEVVRRVRTSLRTAIVNPPPRLSDLVRLVGVQRVPGRPPLFQAIATGYGHGTMTALAMAFGVVECGGYRLELVPRREARTAMELNFAFGVIDGQTRLDLTYAADRYDAAIAEELLHAVTTMLETGQDDAATFSLRLNGISPGAQQLRLSPKDRQTLASWIGDAAGEGDASIREDNGSVCSPLVPGMLWLKGRADRRTEIVARARPDGSIELIGPLETWREQHRSLARIERMMIDCPGVREACLVDQAGSVAAIVGEALPDDVRRWLLPKLARELVPVIVALPSFPRNADGSVDRATISRSIVPASDVLKAQNDIVPELAVAWSDLLGPESLHECANFFACGGDSLIGAILLARLREELRINMSFADLIAEPELMAFSRRVKLACWARESLSGNAEIIVGEL
jgi:aryl carrier-like protein